MQQLIKIYIEIYHYIIESHCGDKAKDIVCDICGNRYRREAGLRQHKASAHSEVREFQCITCGKGFTTQTRLNQHARIHTGIKPFKCVKCGYRSNRADNVLFHLRKVHKVEKPTKDEHVAIEEDLLEENSVKNLGKTFNKVEEINVGLKIDDGTYKNAVLIAEIQA